MRRRTKSHVKASLYQGRHLNGLNDGRKGRFLPSDSVLGRFESIAENSDGRAIQAKPTLACVRSIRSGQRLYRRQGAGAAHNSKGGFGNIAKALKRGNEETDPVAEG